jgi:hypothetical protein
MGQLRPLNLRPRFINAFLTRGSTVYGGAINPSLDGRWANSLDVCDRFLKHPFEIPMGRAPDFFVFSLKIVEGRVMPVYRRSRCAACSGRQSPFGRS